jgi:hypothetical protein
MIEKAKLDIIKLHESSVDFSPPHIGEDLIEQRCSHTVIG